MSRRRSLLPLVVVALSVLTACGASAPPAKELADEVIDTLDVSDDVKACMRAEVADFSLTDQELGVGFNNRDEVAEAAAGDNQQAYDILAKFQAALAACN